MALVLFFIVLAIWGATHPQKSSILSQPAVPEAANATSAASPTPREPGFDDGTFRVGSEIQPGTYRMKGPSGGCYWARLKGLSGELGDILANDIPRGPTVVTIKPTDMAFQSRNCGRWTSNLARITVEANSFDEGTYIVGTDVASGTYRNTGTDSCYWARLRGFSGALGDIIANNNVNGSTLVTIAPGDKGFKSSGCGTWKRG